MWRGGASEEGFTEGWSWREGAGLGERRGRGGILQFILQEWGGYLFIFNITIFKNQIRKCKSLGKITGSPGSSMSYGL